MQNLHSQGLAEHIWEDGTVDVMPLKRAAQLHGAKGKEEGNKGKDAGVLDGVRGVLGGEHGDMVANGWSSPTSSMQKSPSGNSRHVQRGPQSRCLLDVPRV